MLCGNREEAEDAVAEAYARVWPRFRAGTLREPLPYLRTAVVNQVRGGLRKRMLQRREEQRQKVDWRDGVSAERIVDDREVLSSALHRLPAGQRTIVVLRFYEDMSEQDVATLLGVPVGTVKSRCSRGLAALRAAFD
jgi:RNA polymerase sigma factor (sigma-70 family)